MKAFSIYTQDGEELRLKELEKALAESVNTNVPLALELLFVDEEEIRTLNRETRGVDAVTDVLSFPSLDNIRGRKILKKDFPWEIDEQGNLLLGSVVVCRRRAEEQAKEYGHSYGREVHYLIVHGAMHCLGYDHIEEADRMEMRQKEEEVLQKIGAVREE